MRTPDEESSGTAQGVAALASDTVRRSARRPRSSLRAVPAGEAGTHRTGAHASVHDPQDSAVLTDHKHDSRAHKRVVVLAAGTLAVATLSSIAPVPQIVTSASASSSTATVATPEAAQSDAATLDLSAAGAVAGTATTKAVAGTTTTQAVAAVPKPAPKKRAAPKPKTVVAKTAAAAPFAFGTAAYAQWHAKRLMSTSRYGWKATAQYVCLVNLWTRESHWNYRSHNKSSGAHGIPQAMPGSKMRVAGTDWMTNPVTQIRWGLGYIKSRYGSPCGAWSHFRSHNWY